MREADSPSSNTDGVLEAVCRNASQLAQAARRPLRRIKVQSGDTAVEVEWPDEAIAEDAGTGAAKAQPAVDANEGSGSVHYVCSSMVGTFHHAPGPGARPFVVQDDIVDKGQQVGIVEAMKLMNPIEADEAGQVVEILVPNATSIEYGQRLIALAPLGEP